MNVRSYEAGDLPKVIETYTASIHSLAAPFYSPEQIAAWAPPDADMGRWQKRLAGLHTIVAEEEGMLAGFASYTDEGYFDFLHTHPDFARCGVATRLYQQIESVLCSAGCARVFTHASIAARPFFDHQGFEVNKEECVECRGVYLRRFAMHKQLNHEMSG